MKNENMSDKCLNNGSCVLDESNILLLHITDKIIRS